MKRKNFIILLLAVILSVFSGCENLNDEVVSTIAWKGYTENAEIGLFLNDDNTCIFTISSTKLDMHVYQEVLLYEGWYGVNQISLYRGKDYINAEVSYIGKFEDTDKLILVQVVDGEEVFLANLFKVQSKR